MCGMATTEQGGDASRGLIHILLRPVNHSRLKLVYELASRLAYLLYAEATLLQKGSHSLPGDRGRHFDGYRRRSWAR